MSQLLIQHYLNELQTLRRVSGTAREGVVSEAFKTLLKDWGKSREITPALILRSPGQRISRRMGRQAE